MTTTKANDMETYVGNLVIRTNEEAEAYKHLKEVTGGLSINASAKLDALKSVGGYLYIYASAKLDALKSVGGGLSINASAKLDALKSVGGYLSINASAKLDALKSVGGDLAIYASAKLDAPALESVGGYLYINASAKLIAPNLYQPGFDNFAVHDGIGCVKLSSKQLDGVTVHSCRQSKIKNQKLVGDKFYLAESDGKHAHAKTIRDAITELQFKAGNRSVEEFRNMPLATKKTPTEWAMIYRTITGACRLGTEYFVKGKGKLKRSYTLAEILKETAGAYGHQQFKEVTQEEAEQKALDQVDDWENWQWHQEETLMMCPHCGWKYYPSIEIRKPTIPGMVPTHDFPVPCRSVCPGSGQTPRNAETDKRPLWKDE